MTENKEEIKREEKVAVEDNANVSTSTPKKDDNDKDVDNVIMITEGLGKKPYTVDGVIRFIITSDDNGDTAVVGTLETRYFIENVTCENEKCKRNIKYIAIDPKQIFFFKIGEVRS